MYYQNFFQMIYNGIIPAFELLSFCFNLEMITMAV